MSDAIFRRRARRPGSAPSQRGFALLIVLWTLTLIALVVTQLTLAGRGETRLAANLRAEAELEAAAEGGVHEAAFHLLDLSDGHWAADGVAHRIRIGEATVTVVIRNEAGKVNPNTAQPEVLGALLRQLGADAETAGGIANAIADWRFPGARPRPGGARAPEYQAAGRPYGPPGKPFEHLDELGLVLGMTPELLARVTPHLTLYHEGEPDVREAGPPVLRALRETTGAMPLAPPGPPDETIVTITSLASGGNGGRFARHAVVRLASRAGSEGLYTILDWLIPTALVVDP